MPLNPNRKCVDCGTAVSRSDVLRCRSCGATKKWANLRAGKVGPNPTGLCMCGCGQPAPIAPKGHTRLGWVKGHPVRWIHGHENRPSPHQYIVNPDTGCWDWQWMTSSDGYGKLQTKDGCRFAHRIYYERLRGPIPRGKILDHICRNRSCVNPDHLEIVSNTENIRRGERAKLTMGVAEEIRRLYSTGEYTQADLAKQFGVVQSAISCIVLHKTWFHDEFDRRSKHTQGYAKPE